MSSQLHPFVPPGIVAIDKAVALELRAFSIQNLSQLAPIIPDLLLLRLVEVVKARCQRIVQVLDIARRMERLPRADASLALAGLEHEQQRVKPSDYLGERKPEKTLWALFVSVQQIVQLLRVRLFSPVSVFWHFL